MRSRDLLAIVPVLAVTGCTAPAPGDGTDYVDPNDDADTTAPPSAQSPAATDWSIDLQGRGVECASQDAERGTIDFDGNTVTVAGTILGANTCHVARIDGVTYDEVTEEMVIVVESVEAAGEDVACAQCITAIDYTVDVSFTGPPPDRIIVRHRRDESVRTVVSSMR